MTGYNPMKYCMSKILNGNVIYNGIRIPILTEYPPDESVDCVTMNDKGGIPEQNVTVADELSPLPDTHPYYDPNNPDELYAQKLVRLRNMSGTLELHIWGNSDESRDHIVSEVQRIIEEALMFNYKYCVNLDHPVLDCKTTGEQCDALTINNRLGVQGKCPYADITDSTSQFYRNPSTYFDLAGVTSFLTDIKGEVNVDQLNVTPEVYHSVLPINYESEITMEVDVNPICAIDLTHEIVILDPAIPDPAQYKKFKGNR